MHPGDTYQIENQGTSITPTTIEVTIVWVNDDSVYYRKPGSTRVHETSIARFYEIIGEKQ